MNKQKIISAWVGLLVLIGIVALTYLGIQASNVNGFKPNNTFELKAYFSDVSGLGKNATVTLAGVQIGQVKKITLDKTHNYEALVIIEVDANYNGLIPNDSSLEILTAGLLGEKYLGITLGGSETYLNHQDEFIHTGSSIVLEKLIQQVITQMGNKE